MNKNVLFRNKVNIYERRGHEVPLIDRLPDDPSAQMVLGVLVFLCLLLSVLLAFRLWEIILGPQEVETALTSFSNYLSQFNSPQPSASTLLFISQNTLLGANIVFSSFGFGFIMPIILVVFIAIICVAFRYWFTKRRIVVLTRSKLFFYRPRIFGKYKKKDYSISTEHISNISMMSGASVPTILVKTYHRTIELFFFGSGDSMETLISIWSQIETTIQPSEILQESKTTKAGIRKLPDFSLFVPYIVGIVLTLLSGFFLSVRDVIEVDIITNVILGKENFESIPLFTYVGLGISFALGAIVVFGILVSPKDPWS